MRETSNIQHPTFCSSSKAVSAPFPTSHRIPRRFAMCDAFQLRFLFQIELNPAARTGLHVADFHLLQLPLAMDLRDSLRFKLLHQSAFGVVSLSQNNRRLARITHGINVHPRYDADILRGRGSRVEGRGRIWLSTFDPRLSTRVPAFQHVTGLASLEFLPEQPLVGPMEKFQPQIRQPEI